MKRPLFLCQLLLRCEELSWASYAGLLLDVMLGTSGRHCSRSPFRRLTGNDVSGHYFHHYFFPPVFFSPSSPFLIEGVLGSKNLFSESYSEQPYYLREVISDFDSGV